MFKLLNAQLFEKATRLPEKFEKTPPYGPADGSFACNALSVDLSSLRIQRLNGGIVHLYYFAYGSNMNWEQMQRRCPSTRFVCVASLKDYRFAIARHSRLRNCGTANIFADSGSEVWGIVYDVSEPDLTILDGFEDGYRREKLFVRASGNSHSSVEVLVYIAEKEDTVPLPNPEYKRLIIDGARRWNIPESYCSMLEQIQAKDT
jgi:gamma-glutamylcyclotransferase